MAPGGKKNPKAKSKKALSVDFKKVRSKVGRKLAPAQNATKVEFKAKGIVIPGQSVAQDKGGLAVNQRKQTLKELLAQVTHYSERMRKDAMMGLKDLFGKHPKELVMHAVAVIEKLSPRITDTEKTVRQALILLLRSSVLPNLPQAMMKPLVPVMMAHICSAMTHLVLDIRIAACTLTDLLVQHCPNLVVPFFSGQIVQHYTSLLGRGGISGQPGSKLAIILSSLENFLSAVKKTAMTQASLGLVDFNVTHRWGARLDVGNKGGPECLQALHGYKSSLPEGNSSLLLSTQDGGQSVMNMPSQPAQQMQNTGKLGQIAYTSTQLVPVLLECWAEYAPMVCNAPNPDVSSLDSMVLITRCLCHIFQTLTSEAAAGSLVKHMSKRSTLIHVPELGSEAWELHIWMQQQFLPGLNRHLLNLFPIPAPVVRLLPKVEEGLVALNVGICEVMLQFFLPNCDGMQDPQIDAVLQYFEGALSGMMLPSSHFSEGVSDAKLGESHVKSLINYLPGLVMCVPYDWVSRLLQAFTHVFESCNSRSSTKMICLSSMTELVLPESKSGQRNRWSQNVIPVEFQTRWLQSLPRLLWELKYSHSNVSQAVLEMLLYIGRSSEEGSNLAETYGGLQLAMVPFYCTFVPCKQSDESRCVYGPFIKLPKPCQELAADLLYYYSSFSPLFLKALAQCSLCADLEFSVSVRIVEVLQRAFCRGAIGLTEHISFLFTLLAGHISSQGGNSAEKPPMEADVPEIHSYDQNLESEIGGSHGARTGVVCACLSQIGDGNLVLSVLGPAISVELGRRPQLRVFYGFFRAVAVLSHRVEHSDGLFLPESLVDMLPKFVADFLVTLVECNSGSGASGKEATVNTLKRPCLILLARSPRFTLGVLKVIHDFLQRDQHPATLRHKKQKLAFVRVVLEMTKTEKLDRSLSSSQHLVKAIMQTIEAQEDLDTSEGRELKRLREQLQTASGALFGSGVPAEL